MMSRSRGSQGLRSRVRRIGPSDVRRSGQLRRLLQRRRVVTRDVAMHPMRVPTLLPMGEQEVICDPATALDRARRLFLTSGANWCRARVTTCVPAGIESSTRE